MSRNIVSTAFESLVPISLNAHSNPRGETVGGYSSINTNSMEISSIVHGIDNSTSSGFLSGFVEGYVEMPPDGLNGECYVHYQGEHSQCVLMVRLVNGIREGEALMVNDGMPYLRLHYEKGSLTGVVERMNDNGIPEMRGHLVDGVESGLFLEYDEYGNVVWKGTYRNGARYSEVHNRVVQMGCLDDGSSLFYELDENGLPTQLCLYVNGVRGRVIQKFNATTMTELDRNEKKVYEGGFKGDMENGFVREGKGKEFVNDGREAVYYGEWKNGKRDGQGTELKRFKPVYIGEWKDGKRNGNGRELDERGMVMRSGVWVNGVYQGVKNVSPKEMETVVVPKEVNTAVAVPSSLISNPSIIKELKIWNDCYNDSSVTEFKLNQLNRLKHIVIGDDCFESVQLFELDRLNELESVVIGKKSFTVAKGWICPNTYGRGDRSCRIVNCPKLKSIQFGEYTFCDVQSIVFESN